MQPWNGVVFPSAGSNYPILPGQGHKVARALPAFGRGLQVIAGMAMQMPIDVFRGAEPQSRPRLCAQPDPDRSRAWWVGVQVEDYLLHGNAVHVVTSRNAEGYPETVSWVPAEWVTITWIPGEGLPTYWVAGRELPFEDVIHVQRGADRACTWRGVGVVEQHLAALGKISDQEQHEGALYRGAAVPSVVIVSPNAEVSDAELEAAKSSWVEKFGGPVREPALLPKGTEVTPLAWSPADSEMTEARKLSLLDVANMLNLDGAWVGAPSNSLTYKSLAPMYLNLLRQTVGPITDQLEQAWSSVWLPRGREVKFDRKAVLQDDFATTIQTLSAAVKNGLMTQAEAREYLGLPPKVDGLVDVTRQEPGPVGGTGVADDSPADDEGEDAA